MNKISNYVFRFLLIFIGAMFLVGIIYSIYYEMYVQRETKVIVKSEFEPSYSKLLKISNSNCKIKSSLIFNSLHRNPFIDYHIVFDSLKNEDYMVLIHKYNIIFNDTNKIGAIVKFNPIDMIYKDVKLNNIAGFFRFDYNVNPITKFKNLVFENIENNSPTIILQNDSTLLFNMKSNFIQTKLSSISEIDFSIKSYNGMPKDFSFAVLKRSGGLYFIILTKGKSKFAFDKYLLSEIVN